MVLPALSMSISHASFQAELEGAILQQTASVDLYLQTAAPRWSPDSYAHGDDGCSTGLRSLFLSDLNTCSSWHSPAAYSQDLGGSLADAAAAGASPWVLESCRKQRRPRVQPMQADGSVAQLEQFLQDDLHRFMEIRAQLDEQAQTSDAAVLATTADERMRRLSSGSSIISNSGISFVRLPEPDSEGADEEEADEDSHPVAAALAAAAAMSAVSGMCMAAAPDSAAQAEHILAAAAAAAPAAATAVAGGAAAEQQQQPSSPMSSAAPAASAAAAAAAAAASKQFVMEADEDIAAQKRAARARLAELEQQGPAAAAAAPEQQLQEAPACSAKALEAKMADDVGHNSMTAGSLHSSKVPSRPRGLAAMPPPSKPAGSYYQRLTPARLLSKLWELNAVSNDGVLLQHNQFLQHMLAGLVLCVVVLPVLWLLQAEGGSRGAGFLRSYLPASLLAKTELLCHAVYMCTTAGVLVYCLVRSLLLHPPLLHFREPTLERQYLLWSNSGRLFQDCLFQLTFLVVGSCLWLRLLQSGGSTAAELEAGIDVAEPASTGRLILSALTLVGSGLPVLMLVLLRSPRYVEWREPLLAGSRLCSVVALPVMQLAAGPGGLLQLNMPFIALAQVMSIACMQVRLSSFVPSQVLHLLVLVLCTRALNPLLQFTQLFGGWLCLPCLVLYNMEMHSRRAFLATLAPSTHPSVAVAPGRKAVAA